MQLIVKLIIFGLLLASTAAAGGVEDMKSTFEYLYSSKVSSDVTFIIGKNEDHVEAHKLVLTIRSPVFEKMFHGWENSKELLIVKVPHFELEPFEAFLRYLYTGEFPEFHAPWYNPFSSSKRQEALELFVNVFHISKYYDVTGIIDASTNAIAKLIDVSNAVEIYQLGFIAGYDFIVNNGNQFFKKPQSLDTLDLDSLCLLLNDKKLDVIVKEVDKFKTVVRWASNHCKMLGLEPTVQHLREVASDAFILIQFPRMEVNDFETEVYVKYHGLLSDNEAIQIFLIMLKKPRGTPWGIFEQKHSWHTSKVLTDVREEEQSWVWGNYVAFLLGMSLSILLVIVMKTQIYFY